ncbi:MAG: alanine--tRNA ligase [Chloroflexota bacterium]|nr:alanine--tRNA ligase [Chloroflexota bacterium]
MTGDEIRESFLSFFEDQGHLRVSSASLIPVGDPTLLLTNAGMVQFKPYFSGDSNPPNKRLTTAQKAFRTVDIDEVGDSTHLTLFEMLGNFSIGDYFKREAIEFSLKFVTEKLSLSQDDFSATVYLDDDEAYALWKEIGIPEERIYRFGDEDNWWGPAGLEGPCGPCSELHYDFGDDKGCLKDDCSPNCTNSMNNYGDVCNRYVELWNLVFMQFYHHQDGSRTPLPAPSVDTGLGLERAAVILQKVDTIYKTDLFQPLIKKVEDLSGGEYGKDHQMDYSMHAVAEHSRSATFLIADGVVPSNEGRGYVLRRVVRRAIRQARRLGIQSGFLTEMAGVAIDIMGHAYPEQVNHKDFIFTVLQLEEERFQQAFDRGMAVLSEELKVDILSGETLFKLWDTYGFPVEMSTEIAVEAGVKVDLEGFEKEMVSQRDRARAGGQFTGDNAKIRVYESLGIGATNFLGYEHIQANSVVVGLISDGSAVSEVAKGQSAEIILLETPFYPEGGGQVGDGGEIQGQEGLVAIEDTRNVIPDVIVHFGVVSSGKISLGDSVDARVDGTRREDTARNHTATHMLHAALRQILGSHVRQAGSLVASNRLRFDFSHVQPVTQEEIWRVQFLVNEKIRQNANVSRGEDTYSDAIQKGALAFFGDKYDERVRLVEIANGETFSFEVCGGTHVSRTGEIGMVHILSESSVGAGMRRIEAVSGRAAERLTWERFSVQERLAQKLQTNLSDLEIRVDNLISEADKLTNEKESLEKVLYLKSAEKLLDAQQEISGIQVLSSRVEAANADALRDIGDWLRDKMGSGVIVLGTVINDRPMMVVMVTSDLVDKGFNATEIAKQAAKPIQGGGGGRADVAQAGGKRSDKLDEALEGVSAIIISNRGDI